MDILLTGSTGFLGSEVLALLSQQGEITTSVLRTTSTQRATPTGLRAYAPHAPLSVDLLHKTITTPPTHIIHLAALSSPERCETHPEHALYSNVTVTHALASYAAAIGAHMTTASTDLVFDGVGHGIPGGFRESDTPLPSSVYSRSKKAAEEETLNTALGAVVRLSLLYGRSPANAQGTTAWMERGFAEGTAVTLYHDEFRTPLHVRDAARFVLEIARRDLLGVWHCGGPDRLSRVDFGLQIATALGYRDPQIEQMSRYSHPSRPSRPEDVSLNSSLLREATGMAPLSIAAALKSYAPLLLEAGGPQVSLTTPSRGRS